MENEAVTISTVLSDALPPFGGAPIRGLTEQLAQLTSELQRLQIPTPKVENGAAVAGDIGSTLLNVFAPGLDLGPAISGAQSGEGIGGTLLNMFTSGLSLGPLISGIAGLFGGGEDASAPPPLVNFSLPPALRAEAGVRESDPGAAFAVDHSQGGVPRPIVNSAPAQITVQVHAMDSRSFLDHSSEIAMAVRQAMLESNVLSDVIREV